MTRSRPDLTERGFTLIELLITVAVIGILATIAIISFRESMDRAKQRQTMANLRSIATAIEAYETDHSFLPEDGITIDTLATVLAPDVLSTVPKQDAWRNDLVYVSPGMNYTLKSFGRNGVEGPALCTRETRDNFDTDILIIDGLFVASPES